VNYSFSFALLCIPLAQHTVDTCGIWENISANICHDSGSKSLKVHEKQLGLHVVGCFYCQSYGLFWSKWMILVQNKTMIGAELSRM